LDFKFALLTYEVQ